jgi:hypothetical protein
LARIFAQSASISARIEIAAVVDQRPHKMAERAASAGQQGRVRRDRGFPCRAPRGPQSHCKSGLAGGFGCMKRSSGDGVKR